MARLASPQKSARNPTPDTQDTLCTALSEVSLNKVSTKVPPKLKPSSSPRKTTTSSEGHANDQSSSSRRQRVFRLEHVDSMTLPSSNGTSSKSYEQNLLSATRDGGRSPVRATPRRVAKQAISYAVPGVPSLQAELSDSDWSGRERSDDEEDSDVEIEQPRLLWRSPSKATTGQVLKPLSVVDLTSPDKSATRKPAEPARPQPARRRSSTLDSVGDDLAILSLSVHPLPPTSRAMRLTHPSSPPRSRSPHKAKAAPGPAARPITPPRSPPKSRLNSPTKATRIRIPPTPHQPDVDAFWSQEIVNAWTDEYSPKKVLASPRKQYFELESQTTVPPPTSPTKSRSGSPRKSPTKQTQEARAATAAKKAFEASREATATAFLAELDARITNGAIACLTESTGGVKLVWSNKLNTTAGRATWKCETVRPKALAATSAPLLSNTANIISHSTPGPVTTSTAKLTHHHHATIELASKVITSTPRLLNVLAHEFCHLANFMVSGVRDQPHGASFKRWAALASREFGDRDVEVTTKHSYEIEYRYGWVCVGGGRSGSGGIGGAGVGVGVGVGREGGTGRGCGMEYQRHSKSIDPSKHTCGVCKGRLLQIRPVPRGLTSASTATPPASSTLPLSTVTTGASAETSTSSTAPSATAPSAYQQFVKAQFAVVRQELGAAVPMSEVMREIGARYRNSKAKGTGTKPAMDKEGSSKGGRQGQIEVIEILDSDDELEVVDGHGQGHKYGVGEGLRLDAGADVDVDVDVTVADEDQEDDSDVDDVDELDELVMPALGGLSIADD